MFAIITLICGVFKQGVARFDLYDPHPLDGERALRRLPELDGGFYLLGGWTTYTTLPCTHKSSAGTTMSSCSLLCGLSLTISPSR
jgi:hypothetical protein